MLYHMLELDPLSSPGILVPTAHQPVSATTAAVEV
jgi:hypothetical protein